MATHGWHFKYAASDTSRTTELSSCKHLPAHSTPHGYVPFFVASTLPAGIAVATMGALVLVQLIRTGAAGSPAYIIGYYLSSWLSQGFLAISAFLGALGSFFSGSTTVSNLTFGDIQKVRA